MPFLPIPAIDLMDGQVVRLSRGEAEARTVYSDNPVAVARNFEQAGARRLHVVDLNGAFQGEPVNMDIVRAIRESTSMQIELGGGLRSIEQVNQALTLGVDYAILGTAALRDRTLVKQLADACGPSLIVGIDVREGMVAIEGWLETSDLPAVDFARQLQDMGVGTAIATDIASDGMMTGPDLEFYRELATAAPSLQLIASGGVRGLDDLIALRDLKLPNLIGAISGRAIYENQLDLAQAVRRLADLAEPSASPNG